MYKSIFPASADGSAAAEIPLPFKSAGLKSKWAPNAPTASPSALATFPSHLTDLLFDTLKQYLPNVQDKTSKESLLTQILYCAGSLGRLGGDFSLMLAMLSSVGADESVSSDDDDESGEGVWVEVMKKHRELAGRLEALASGVGAGKGIDKVGSFRIKS